MSNINTNKKQHTANGKHSSKKNNAKKKRKFWFEEKPKNKRLESGNHREVELPKDAEHISANWKALQEILKNSEPSKQPLKGSSNQRHVLHTKKTTESSSAIVCKNNIGQKPRKCEGKEKHENVSNSVVPEDAQDGTGTVKHARPPNASKRKRKNGQPTNESIIKKKKMMVVEKKPTSDDLWFDDVDPDDIEATIGAEAADIIRKREHIHIQSTESALVKEKAFDGLTRAVAIDCEMVGVGPDGEDSILARVSLVNRFGKCIYDKFVKPTEKVTDYRTAVSGIRPKDIRDGEDVMIVRKEVAEIVQGRIIVGHAIHNDLKILLLDHPKKKIRDTQKYKPFRRTVKSVRPSLKVLCKEILNVKVQQGEHSSVQDAQATMRLYTMVKKKWEAEIKASHNKKDSDQKIVKRKPKLPRNTGRNPFGK